MYASTDYLEQVVACPSRVAEQVLDACLRLPRFDAFAFRGLSGSLVTPIVAAKLDKPMVVVRKGEKCHSSLDCESGITGAFKYVIVDDLISSGQTMVQIIKVIQHRFPRAQPVGIILYFEDTYDRREEFRVEGFTVPVVQCRDFKTTKPRVKAVQVDTDSTRDREEYNAAQARAREERERVAMAKARTSRASEMVSVPAGSLADTISKAVPYLQQVLATDIVPADPVLASSYRGIDCPF